MNKHTPISIADNLIILSNKILIDDGTKKIKVQNYSEDFIFINLLVNEYRLFCRQNKFKLFKKIPNISFSNMILRSIIINLVQFNFWKENENKNKEDSQKMIELIDSVFKNDSSYDFLPFNINALINIIKTYDFKMKKTYFTYLNEFIEVCYTKKFKDFTKEITLLKLSDDEIIYKLGELLPKSYGNDKFYKREILCTFFINQAKEKFGYMVNQSNLLYPIDYRIPSVLIDFGIIKINKFMKKELYNNIHIKNDNIDLLIRAAAYKALVEITNNFNIVNYKFDEFLFWYAKNKNLKIHRTETNDY